MIFVRYLYPWQENITFVHMDRWKRKFDLLVLIWGKIQDFAKLIRFHDSLQSLRFCTEHRDVMKLLRHFFKHFAHFFSSWMPSFTWWILFDKALLKAHVAALATQKLSEYQYGFHCIIYNIHNCIQGKNLLFQETQKEQQCLFHPSGHIST